MVVDGSDFCWSCEAPDELELSPPEGEDVVAPLPAEPLLLEELLLLGLVDEAPPLASFFCVSDEVEDEELDGAELGVDGVLVEPEAEPEAEPDGVLDGLVVVEEPVAARSLPARSHAVSRLAPSAMETAIAMVESLMWPPWLGYLGC